MSTTMEAKQPTALRRWLVSFTHGRDALEVQAESMGAAWDAGCDHANWLRFQGQTGTNVESVVEWHPIHAEAA